jgi:D-arginine dehydrogenase
VVVVARPSVVGQHADIVVERADVAVVGAGIAGASVAAALAEGGASVVLLEAEARPGHHTTGRSAAVFTENYGNAPVRRLTVASRAFLTRPPDGFTDAALLHPRGALWVADDEQLPRLDAIATEAQRLVPSVRRIDAAEALERCPALDPTVVAGAVLEPEAQDIDVDALLQGYLRSARRHGGRLIAGARVTGLHRAGAEWQLTTTAGDAEAATVIDAAGAWADEVAALAGARPLGLTPLRRTAFLFDPPDGVDARAWPLVIDADERCYFRPEGGRLMGSPADETPSPPVDARPEELDVALGLDRLGRLLGRELTHASNPWAGLRTFAPDRTPVVGPDPSVDGFVWLAGQGGYGIQTAPAMAAAAAAHVLEGTLPDADLLPARFQRPDAQG